MKAKPKTLRGRALGMETLEHREVLAGNITATLIGGTLRIVGDNQANVATLKAGGANQLVLTGVSTRINGVLAPKTFDGVRSIVVTLNSGDDSFVIGGTITSEDPLALAGTPLAFNGRIQIDGGNGNDQLGVLVSGATLISVDGGFGDDQIGILNSSSRTSISVYGGSGAGDDQIALAGLSAVAITVATGAGDDSIDFANSTAGQVTISSGDGIDTVGIDNVDPRTQFFVDLGADEDLLTFDNVNTLQATILGGDGDDGIAIGSSNIRTTLKVDVGEGDNTLTIENTSASIALLVGGSGENYLNDVNNTFGRKRLFNVS